MSTDRELLEAAAQAAGITLMWSTMSGMGPRNVETGNTWNPLTDDGDAFRLAVALSMRVEVWPEPVGGMLGIVSFRDSEIAIQAEQDRAAATRRAIVRAAAAMART